MASPHEMTSEPRPPPVVTLNADWQLASHVAEAKETSAPSGIAAAAESWRVVAWKLGGVLLVGGAGVAPAGGGVTFSASSPILL